MTVLIFVRLFHALLFAQACALCVDESSTSTIVSSTDNGGGRDRTRNIMPRRYPIMEVSLWQIKLSILDDTKLVRRNIFDETRLWLGVSSGVKRTRGAADELTDPIARILANFPIKQKNLQEHLEHLKNHAFHIF